MSETAIKSPNIAIAVSERVLDAMQAAVAILVLHIESLPDVHTILNAARTQAILEVCIDSPDVAPDASDIVRDHALVEINQRLDAAFAAGNRCGWQVDE